MTIGHTYDPRSRMYTDRLHVNTTMETVGPSTYATYIVPHPSPETSARYTTNGMYTMPVSTASIVAKYDGRPSTDATFVSLPGAARYNGLERPSQSYAPLRMPAAVATSASLFTTPAMYVPYAPTVATSTSQYSMSRTAVGPGSTSGSTGPLYGIAPPSLQLFRPSIPNSSPGSSSYPTTSLGPFASALLAQPFRFASYTPQPAPTTHLPSGTLSAPTRPPAFQTSLNSGLGSRSNPLQTATPVIPLPQTSAPNAGATAQLTV